jgi:hypothetical protein
MNPFEEPVSPFRRTCSQSIFDFTCSYINKFPKLRATFKHAYIQTNTPVKTILRETVIFNSQVVSCSLN